MWWVGVETEAWWDLVSSCSGPVAGSEEEEMEQNRQVASMHNHFIMHRKTNYIIKKCLRLKLSNAVKIFTKCMIFDIRFKMHVFDQKYLYTKIYIYF